MLACRSCYQARLQAADLCLPLLFVPDPSLLARHVCFGPEEAFILAKGLSTNAGRELPLSKQQKAVMICDCLRCLLRYASLISSSGPQPPAQQSVGCWRGGRCRSPDSAGASLPRSITVEARVMSACVGARVCSKSSRWMLMASGSGSWLR